MVILQFIDVKCSGYMRITKTIQPEFSTFIILRGAIVSQLLQYDWEIHQGIPSKRNSIHSHSRKLYSTMRLNSTIKQT